MNKQPLIFTFVSIFLFYASVKGADLEPNDVPPVESDQQNGWSLWPKDIAGRIVGQAAQQSAVHASRFTKENIRLANQAAQTRLDQAAASGKQLVDHSHQKADQLLHRANTQAKERIDQAHGRAEQLADQANIKAKALVNHTGDRLDQTVARTLQQDGPLDRATGRVLGQAIHHLETTANHVVADATGQLQATTQQVVANARNELQATSHHILANEMQPVGHALIVDLAQNVGKMFLSSIMGGFGAVLAYKNLIDYFEAQKDAKVVYAKWQDQQREKYADHEDAGIATLLSKKLREAGLINSGNEQRVRAYLAAAGATTFAVACVLCCYWIR